MSFLGLVVEIKIALLFTSLSTPSDFAKNFIEVVSILDEKEEKLNDHFCNFRQHHGQPCQGRTHKEL